MTVLKSSIKMEAPRYSQGFGYAQHLSSLPKSQKILYMLPAFRKRRTLNN